MKKIIIPIIILLAIGAIGWFVIPKEQPVDDEVMFGSIPQHPWENRVGLEDASKRTHITKDYAHPTDPTKRIKIQSSGLLHYFDGKEFQDLPDLPFPEGKEITEPKSRHFMMNLPDWGEAKVEKNGKQVRVYDKLGQPIYIFKNPLVVPKGKNPYKVVDKNGKKIKETKDRKEKIDIDERIEKSDDAVEADFEVEDNKLYFKLPKDLSYPLEAYDDTDTSSTNVKDVYIDSEHPNNNYDYNSSPAADDLWVTYMTTANAKIRTLSSWVLSAGSGTISQVKIFLKCVLYKSAAGINVHELTGHTDWGETTATWNTYDGSNNWSSAGGDYDETIIDSHSLTGTGWKSWVLMGAGADNPLTLDWEDNVHLLFKIDSESGGDYRGGKFEPRSGYTGSPPYLEITYEPAAARRIIITQ